MDVEKDTDEEETEDVKLDNGREHHLSMVFEENDLGVDYKKALLHDKRWYFCVNEKENTIKDGYLVEVSCSERKKVLWEVIYNHVVEKENAHDEIGLQGFGFNLFDGDKEGFGREGSSENPYL